MVVFVFNGILYVVMMCMLCDFEVFVVGFVILEGIVVCGSDIKDIEVILYVDVLLLYVEVYLDVV